MVAAWELIQAPAEPGNTLYKVLWQVDDQAVPLNLRMELDSEVLVRAGTRIRGELSGGRWSWTLETVAVQCRALWSVWEDWQPDGSDLRFLAGHVLYQNRYEAIAQLRPGELVILHGTDESAQHLALVRDNHFERGLEWGLKLHNRSAVQSGWFEGDTRFSRALLMIGNDSLLSGICREDSLRYSLLELDDVRISLYAKAGNYWSIKREFRVSPKKETRAQPKPPPRAVEKDSKTRLLEYLERSYDDPARRLTGKAQGRSVVLTDFNVPLNPSWTEWTNRTIIPADEMSYMDSRHARYLQDCRVVLLRRDDNSIYASFRQVPPLTPDAFMTDVGGTFGKFTQLKSTLYYAGEVKINSQTGEEFSELHHRFEWGAGKMLVAPESRLRFDGKPFSTSRFLLNECDMITGVTFVPYVSPESHQDNEVLADEDERGPSCRIEITTFKLNTEERVVRPSQRTQLYNQRDKYRIVHMLHLRADPKEGRVHIAYVEAFNERGVEPSWFCEESNATLDDDSQERVLRRLPKRKPDDSDEAIEVTILGRLNEATFRRTRGASVQFQYVRLTFEESDEGPALKDGEQIFLKSKGVDDGLTNDLALILTWKGLVDPVDVGRDFRRLILLRRSFSVRENLLQRIPTRELTDGKLLVQVTRQVSQRGERVTCSLIDNPALRTRGVLRTMIEQQNLFLAVVSVSEHPGAGDDRIRIELKPSVFVELTQKQMEGRLEKFENGGIIQIENCPDDKFRVQRAAYGDLRYVSDGLRLGLALPKTYLFKEDYWKNPDVFHNWYWQKKRERKGFTIGGLPNLIPLPGTPDFEARDWKEAQANDLIKLMKLPHPEKIVVIGKDSSESTRFCIAPVSANVGSLHMAEGGLSVYYVPLGKPASAADSLKLRWHLLSFGDQSVEDLVDRINREHWEYHDRKTATIVRRDGNMAVSETSTGKHDCWRGPLFFESTTKAPRLRYSHDSFLKFGFPVEELILALLAKKDRKATYPVAAVPEEGGLWIEIVPGRIVELPPRLVIGKVRHEEVLLGKLLWEAFAPGDLVELQITSSNPLLVDRIVLRDWKPGPRGAFGTRCALLPVIGREIAKGALTLGAGEYTLSIPMSSPNLSWDVVALYPSNRIHDGKEYGPTGGDSVLLGIGENGEPTVLGFSEMIPEPERKKHRLWEGDPFAEDIIANQRAGGFYDKQGLRQLIKAAGGALPVTVEFVLKKDNGRQILFFSRKNQRLATSRLAGRLSLARVVGLYRDGESALLRCGGDLVKIKMNQLISGLPNDQRLNRQAIAQLRDSGDLIHLYGDEKGGLRASLPVLQKDQPMVKALHLVSVERESSDQIGLICRSEDTLGLYWLPAKDAAWTTLSAEQLDSIFLSARKEYFQARRRNERLSVVHTMAASKEFKSYKLGKQLVVRILKQIEAGPS